MHTGVTWTRLAERGRREAAGKKGQKGNGICGPPLRGQFGQEPFRRRAPRYDSNAAPIMARCARPRRRQKTLADHARVERRLKFVPYRPVPYRNVPSDVCCCPDVPVRFTRLSARVREESDRENYRPTRNTPFHITAAGTVGPPGRGGEGETGRLRGFKLPVYTHRSVLGSYGSFV